MECELGVLQGLELRICQGCGLGREDFLEEKPLQWGLEEKERRLPLGFSIPYSIPFLWVQ